jgi:hypothetical protein
MVYWIGKDYIAQLIIIPLAYANNCSHNIDIASCRRDYCDLHRGSIGVC